MGKKIQVLFKKLFAFVLSIGFVLTNLSLTTNAEAKTVEIEDEHGVVEVPVNPEVVVALDNRTFETLEAMDVKLAAVPKDVMNHESSYVSDEEVLNIGNHREPDLELIAGLQPDLVIVGQRFAKYYEEIKELVPEACVVDFSFDVSEEADDAGSNLINGLEKYTLALGKIFEQEEKAEELVKQFNEAKEKAVAAYEETDGATVLSVVVSGGEIGFSAPHSGRVWGPLYDVFGWKPSLEIEDASSDHKGDDISVEAIAQSNPDWLLVLDRDAAVSSAQDSAPAKDVIEGSQALQQTDAIKDGKVVYAPAKTYTSESIQTFIVLFNDLAEAFSNN